MIGYEYTIELYDDATGFGYEVDVDITHFLLVEPDDRADNPDDYYGYNEIEFDIVDIYRYDDSGDCIKVSSIPDSLDDPLREQVEILVLRDYDEEKYGSY